MGTKLYVGNLSYNTTSEQLGEMFHAFGAVRSAQVIEDRMTGRSKGFGFVEMETDAEAQAAISGLNGQIKGGRSGHRMPLTSPGIQQVSARAGHTSLWS